MATKKKTIEYEEEDMTEEIGASLKEQNRLLKEMLVALQDIVSLLGRSQPSPS